MDLRAYHDCPGAGGAPDPASAATDAPEERWLRCRPCGAPLAREADRLPADSGAEGAYVNPHGVVFDIVAVLQAPGALPLGPATLQATWFPGYAWQHALCAGCHSHIGWRYAAPDRTPPSFFGIRTEALRP